MCMPLVFLPLERSLLYQRPTKENRRDASMSAGVLLDPQGLLRVLSQLTYLGTDPHNGL